MFRFPSAASRGWLAKLALRTRGKLSILPWRRERPTRSIGESANEQDRIGPESLRLPGKAVKFGKWKSLFSREIAFEQYFRDAEVACSNHVAPTFPTSLPPISCGMRGFERVGCKVDRIVQNPIS